MNKELTRVSAVVLLMFLALFVSTSVIEVGAADTLRADGRNSRTLYASYSAERGPIWSTAFRSPTPSRWMTNSSSCAPTRNPSSTPR